MALVKNVTFNQLIVNGNGTMDAYWTVEIVEDGAVIFSDQKHKHIEVMQDVSAEPNILQNVSAAVWTAGVQSARLAEINAENALDPSQGIPFYNNWTEYWADNPVT